MKTSRRRSLTRSTNKGIPPQIAPVPALYKNQESQCIIWDVFADDGLAVSLGHDWEKFPAREASENDRYHIEYSILGGRDNQVFDVKVTNALAGNHDIQWIYIRTKMGGQIKYIPEDRDAHVIFAMAEEDAYMFCPNDPCLQCAFGCKLGFEMFAYSVSEGLLREAVNIIYTQPVKNLKG